MFEGSYVALVTPFYPDGSINFDRLKQLCQWHVENGTDGLVVLGTTGESSTTDTAEDAAIVRCCVDAIGGRIPVIAGGGSNCTETSLAKSRKFRDLGADGLLLITPYYNKANQKGMYRHFATVAEAVDLPIILYNVPGPHGLRTLRGMRRGAFEAAQRARHQGGQRQHLLHGEGGAADE